MQNACMGAFCNASMLYLVIHLYESNIYLVLIKVIQRLFLKQEEVKSMYKIALDFSLNPVIARRVLNFLLQYFYLSAKN